MDINQNNISNFNTTDKLEDNKWNQRSSTPCPYSDSDKENSSEAFYNSDSVNTEDTNKTFFNCNDDIDISQGFSFNLGDIDLAKINLFDECL